MVGTQAIRLGTLLRSDLRTLEWVAGQRELGDEVAANETSLRELADTKKIGL